MPPQRVAFATNPPSAAPSHSVLSSTLIDSGIIGDMRPEALAEKSPGSVAPLKSNSKGKPSLQNLHIMLNQIGVSNKNALIKGK